MGYVNELLGNDEAIVFQTRQHWFLLFAQVLTEAVLLALLLAAVLVLPQAFPQMGAVMTVVQLGSVALAIILIISALGDYLRWAREEFIVTDRRVIQLRGIFTKNILDLSLEKINDIQMSQSVFGRMFDYGTIEILTASEQGINRMDRIAHPLQFKKAMLDARSRYDRYLDRSPVQAYDNNVQTTLTQLAALHANGVLNDAEFEAKKREVLKRI